MEYPEISDTAAAKVRYTAPVYSERTPGNVHAIKERAAALITLIEEVQKQYPETAREAALAITHVQTASFFAVFAATAAP